MSDEVMTFDEILSDPIYKSEFDRRITKAISTVQAKLDAEIKKHEGDPSVDDFTTLTQECDAARNDLAAANAKVQQFERERYMLSKGVTADDVDYYVYKASQMVSDKMTFEQAAEEVLKTKQNRARVDLGGSFAGGGTQKTANDMMNALIRGAGK